MDNAAAERDWHVREAAQKPVWAHQFHEVTLSDDEGVRIPGLFCKRVKSELVAAADGPRPAMLFLDEAGKWSGFRHGGYLAETAGILKRENDKNEPSIFSIDVSGLGELAPQPAYYDVASWNDIERILTYLSIASGKPVMGLRVRDALRAWHYLRSRPDVDGDRLILAGKGVGAVVALLTSLFAGRFHKLILWNSLTRYEALTEQFPFAWSESVIVPHILKNFDLPDVLKAADCVEKVVINPLDADRKPVSPDIANRVYADSAKVFAELDEKIAKDVFVKFGNSSFTI